MQPSSQAQLKISKHSTSEGTEKIPQLNHKHSGFRCHKRHHKRDRGLDPVSNHVLLQMGQTITSFLLSALGPTSAIRNAMSRLLSKMPAKIVTFPASGRPWSGDQGVGQLLRRTRMMRALSPNPRVKRDSTFSS
jgi:hypothetical protein